MRLQFSSATLGLVLLSVPTLVQAAGPSPVGTWLTEDGRAKIRMEKCGEGNANLCGYVVWLKDPLTDKGQPRTDIKNPDPAKRTRPSIGLELMEQLKPDDDNNDGAHFVGDVYNADNGKSYGVTVGVEKAEELQVKGCMLKFLCGSQTWTKVADVPLPASATKVVQNAPKKAAVPVVPAVGQHPHDTQTGH